ncbi:MAG: DUF1304 domain-containing protein [Pseudomonadota bacterium]
MRSNSVAAVSVGVVEVAAMLLEIFRSFGPVCLLSGLHCDVDLASLSPDQALIQDLVQNLGLYNGFIGVGLILSVVLGIASARQIQLYLCGCVVLAGLFGAATVSLLLLVQAAIGGVGLVVILASKPGEA